MITSLFGKIFLEAYNEEYGTSYDARSFFIEKFYPLFFDQNKYMMYVTNSPFVQHLPNSRECMLGKLKFEGKEKRQERLESFLLKVDNSEPDASIAVGYPSLDVSAKTSGQVTNISMKISKEEIFYSWIGGALGITVKGSFSILFKNKKILLDIYKGWEWYRQALNQIPKLDGNKINSWNGQWLSHFYDTNVYNVNSPMDNFYPYETDKSGFMYIQTQSWTKVLIGITKHYDLSKELGYIYNLGNTNTTVGFIPFDLEQIHRPIEFYQMIFGENDGREAEKLWGTAYGFEKVCMNGEIGVKAMEPKGLREYFLSRGNKGPTIPKAPKDKEQEINYNVYKSWILAMLNNKDLWVKSQRLAELLNEASVDKDKSHSTKRKNLVETVLEAVNKKQFVAAMTDVMAFVSNKEELKGVVKDINEMSTDNVPYFLTLLRFQYKSL